MSTERKPKLKPVKWICARCQRPVKLIGSPPDKCEHCNGDTFKAPELMPRAGEVQA